MNFENKKCLVAYYSRAGYNYVSGNIINLSVGNTEIIANMIKEKVGADSFFIDTVNPYPEDYMETTEVAKIELRNDERPELTYEIGNMQDYDVIFLGYPNWWGTFPMAVFTFLETYDFSGKTIIPFCTHEGSGIGHSVKDIKKLCPESTVIEGIEFWGSSVRNQQNNVGKWLEKI